MPTIGISIDVNVSAETAYDQWRQFEKLPQFTGVGRQIEQLNDNALQRKTEIVDQDTEWDSEITCQTPYHRTVWASQPGATEGIVSFHAISDVMSKVLVQVPDTSEGVAEHVGDGLGAMSFRVRNDLERFKAFVETDRQETGTAIDSLPYQAFP